MRWFLFVVVACAPVETVRPQMIEETVENRPLHAEDARCAPEAMAILDQADRVMARDPERTMTLTEKLDIPSGCSERMRAHRVSLRISALRMMGAPDIDVVRDLGDATFDTSACKEDFAARCEEQRAWFVQRFPNFVEASRVAIRPMDRIPITPDGRLVREYLDTIDNRLALLPGDVFAMTIVPTSIRDAGEGSGMVELRVDGYDVDDKDGDGIKKGAHVHMLVPRRDFTGTPQGAVVVLLTKSTWKTRGRLAFFSR